MSVPSIEINYDRAADIKLRFEVLKKQKPELRARNAAQELNISEGELLASHVGETAVKLDETKIEEILASLEPLGELMALTRNEYCVHERKGIYANCSFATHGKMRQGLFVNADIDLRLFMSHWKHVFAQIEESKNQTRKSLQFFDKSGEALHKVYLTNKSNEAEFDKLVEKFRSKNQEVEIAVEGYEAKKADLPDAEIDINLLKESWANLKDTHDFFPMLMKLKLGRKQALRLVGEEFAYQLPNNCARKVLEIAAEKQVPIMVFVGNRGCIQIHSGCVKKLVEMGPWFNVLDPQFNLHLREDKIAEIWVTRKPTIDGIVTALEVFDENDELIVTFFGKRKPGIPELEEWREIVKELN